VYLRNDELPKQTNSITAPTAPKTITICTTSFSLSRVARRDVTDTHLLQNRREYADPLRHLLSYGARVKFNFKFNLTRSTEFESARGGVPQSLVRS
jgi:hypothetical protein